ncbi:MAG: M28 family peptidase [Planctomycetota bacterium]
MLRFAWLVLVYGVHRSAFSADPLPPPFTPGVFRSHVELLASDDLAGRFPGTGGSQEAAEYIVEQLKQAGWQPFGEDGGWVQSFPVELGSSVAGMIAGQNILARMPGRGELANEAVIFTAHYDHIGILRADQEFADDFIYNGADDNASGVAVILMIAQAFADADDLPDSHRTLIFASFDAEEQGLVGARHYVRHPRWPLEKTAAVINFDGVGRLRLGKFFASDAETSPVLAEFVRAAARGRGLVAETNFGGHGRSDHVPFQEQRIPGMHFFTGAHRDYHQLSDEADRLNPRGGALVASIGYHTVRKAATHPGPLEFKELEPKFRMSVILHLIRSMGLIPNVNAQEGRYPEILFVVPGSAASKHGMRSGDKITSLNGMRINRVEDTLVIFPQLTYEDGLRMTVLRGDGDKEIEVSLPAEFFAGLNGPESQPLENGKHAVEFVYRPSAKPESVAVAGSFNNWRPAANPMTADEKGVYRATVELAPGVYEYKFVVDGKTWESDPRNLNQTGPYDNSVLSVGPRDE